MEISLVLFQYNIDVMSKSEIIRFARDIFAKLQYDALNGRWQGLYPQHFNLNEYDGELTISLIYTIDNLGSFHISLDVFLPEHCNPTGIQINICFLKNLHTSEFIINKVLEALQSMSVNFKRLCPQVEEFVNPTGFCIYNIGNYISKEADCYIEFSRLIDAFVSYIKEFRLRPVNVEKHMRDRLKMFMNFMEDVISDCEIITDIDEVNSLIERGHFVTDRK